MNGPDKHLTEQQIEWLVAREQGEIRETATTEELDAARQHLAECKECQRAVEMHSAIQRRLVALRVLESAGQREDCPSIEKLYGVAAGIESREEVEKVTEHATHCDHCGPLLRQAVADFTNDLTSEEQSFLAELPSARPDLQRELSARLATGPSKARPQRRGIFYRPFLGWRWAIASVALITLVAWTTWTLWPRPEARVERLLAQAYSEHRNLEMRIPNATFAPVHVERGSNESLPAPLHEALAVVMRELSKRPDDPDLLAEKGRAQLLAGDYQGALDTLEHARRLKPASNSILVDLATANFQVAESGGPSINVGTALDLLGQVLEKNPNDPVALYNRAIANGRIPANEPQAIKDWQQYLSIDPHSEWSGEARLKLEDLQQKIRSKPTTQAPSSSSTMASSTLLGSADEDALDLALREWLPESVKASTSPTSHLVALATKLEHDHGDHWLLEILHSKRTPSFRTAITELALAVQSDSVGDTAGAITHTNIAELSFNRAGSQAGFVRARLERVYALQRSLRANECMATAKQLEHSLYGHSYRWAEIQLLLEEAACENMIGNLGYEAQHLARAESLARSHSYGVLYLRALGFAGSLESVKGNWSQFWEDELEGLQVYASGHYPVLRAYQFFSDMALTAEDAHRWHLALELWRAAIALARDSGNVALEAQSTFQLASLEGSIGDNRNAMDDFLRSGQLYSRLPNSDAVRAYLLNGEISLAALEARSQNSSSALARLEKVRPDLHLASDYEIPLHFYQTLGQLYMSRNQIALAERALTTAVSIAEWGLTSLPENSDKSGWERNTSEAYRALVELRLRSRNDAEGALVLWEWYRGASWRPRRFSDSTLNLQELETVPLDSKLVEVNRLLKIPRDTVVLVYAKLISGYAGWIVSQGNVRGAFLPREVSSLEALGETFTEECSEPSTNLPALQTHARQLFQSTVEPFARQIDSSGEIALETDGVLDQIPFPALLDDSGRYFGTQHAILTYPGVVESSHLRTPRPLTGSESALVVGAPALSPKLSRSYPNLPDAREEAAAIAARFNSAVLLIGQDATLDRVTEKLPQTEIFHFAGHSFSTRDHGGLLLASAQAGGSDEPSILLATTLDSHAFHKCRLVVLSACATGKSHFRDFSEPQGLIQVFQQAGVPSVVASRWNVDSASTAAFMRTLYTQLLKGGSTATAVRKAAISVQGQAQTTHPYYWAAFTTFGISN